MKKIAIECSDEMAQWVLGMLDLASVRLKEQAQIEVSVPQPSGHRARVGYRVLNPAGGQDALAALGEHTILGTMFKDVLDATIQGRLITSREVRENRHFKATTIDTNFVKLRQSGLIESVTL